MPQEGEIGFAALGLASQIAPLPSVSEYSKDPCHRLDNYPIIVNTEYLITASLNNAIVYLSNSYLQSISSRNRELPMDLNLDTRLLFALLPSSDPRFPFPVCSVGKRPIAANFDVCQWGILAHRHKIIACPYARSTLSNLANLDCCARSPLWQVV